MLRTFGIFVGAILVAVVFARTLTFGRDKPDRPAPSAVVAARPPAVTPPARGAVVITVTADGVKVSPSRAQDGTLPVRVINGGPQMAEVLIRGRGVKQLVQLGTGEQRDERLELRSGRYSVIARPLTEGDAAALPPTGVAHLRISAR